MKVFLCKRIFLFCFWEGILLILFRLSMVENGKKMMVTVNESFLAFRIRTRESERGNRIA